jgi:hypothetical protein
MSETRNNTNARSRRPLTLVDRTVKEYRSQIEDRALEAFNLVQLASASLAEATWLLDGEADPEEVFEHCKLQARANLKDRAGRLQTKVLAGEAQSRAAH